MRGLFLHAFRPVAVAAFVTVLLAGCSGSVAPTNAPTNPGTNGSIPRTPVAPAPRASGEPTPLAAWHLDGNGTGSPGQPLTFVGSHKFDHGAVALDGVTGYGATAGAGPLDTTAGFTVAAWVTLGEKTPFGSVLSQVGDTAAAFYLGVGEGRWAFSMKDMDTNTGTHTIRAMGTPAAVDPALWVHVAGVFDHSAGKIVLYLDGALAAETPFDAPWQAHGRMVVGGAKARGALSDLWPGAIDAATVYQASLTGDEIARLRDATRPTAAAPVVAPPSLDPAVELFRGTWDYALTDADSADFRQNLNAAAAEAGKPGAKVAFRFGVNRLRWWQGYVLDGELWLLHGVPEGDGGTMTVDGDSLTMTNGRDGWLTYRWAIDHDRLTLALVDCVVQDRSGACPDRAFLDMLTSHTYTRSGTDPTF